MGHSVRQSKSYLSRTLFYSVQSFCLKMRKALCIQPLGFVALSVILLKSLAFGYLCGFDPHKDGRTAIMIKRNLLYKCKRLKKNCVISAKTKSCEKKLYANRHDKMSANDITRLKAMYKC